MIENTIAPAISYEPCSSSQVSAFGYCPATKTLGVKFKAGSGSTYHYNNVPPEAYEAMKKSESVGKFIGSAIKGKYEFARQAEPKDESAT